jgi:hypothetical protein
MPCGKPSYLTSWIEPGNFNSSLSAPIWVVQLLVFYDSALKEQQGRGETLKIVKIYCDEYLQQTVKAPMGEILRWRLLLFTVSGTSVGTHEASWDESEQVLTYENTELRMDQIPSLLESEYQGCSQLLHRYGALEHNTFQHSSRMTIRAFNVRVCVVHVMNTAKVRIRMIDIIYLSKQ